jgi:antitoxin YefM
MYIKYKDMLTTTITDFRKDIRKYLDTVTNNFETLIINRGKDSGVVVISLDEYNSLCATQHELSSKTNEKRLDSAIDKLRGGSSSQKELLDL